MGTPITDPSEIEYGSDCPTCTPSLFDADKTPKIIKVVFHGIEECPGFPPPAALPNDRIFLCEQLSWAPCYFWSKVITGDWWARLMLGPAWSQLICRFWDESFEAFWADLYPVCSYSFANQLVCNGNTCTGGFGYAMSKAFKHERDADHIPYTLAKTYNLTNLSTVLYDSFPCGIDHQIVRLARKSDHTNILIYCDNQEFPP